MDKMEMINKIRFWQPFCNSIIPPYKRLFMYGYNPNIPYKWGVKEHFRRLFRFRHILDYIEVLCWIILVRGLIDIIVTKIFTIV